jgi:hypothetical protein
VEVSLEKVRTGLKPEVAGELAWESVVQSSGSNNVTLAASPGNVDKTGNTTWTGDITLPNGTDTLRLLIKEFEVYSEPGLVPIVRRRLVYADAIEMAP